MTDAERHLIHCHASFRDGRQHRRQPTPVLNLYKHINAPEARMYPSRQLFEEALHAQFLPCCWTPYVRRTRPSAPLRSPLSTTSSIQRKARFA